MTQRPRVLIVTIAVWTLLAPIGTTAQTPEATPGASPATAAPAWQVVESREYTANAELALLSHNATKVLEANLTPLDVNGHVTGPPVFSPDGEHALVHGGQREYPETSLCVVDLETGIAHPVRGARNEPHMAWLVKPPTWAQNDSVFIPGQEGGKLVTLERDS